MKELLKSVTQLVASGTFGLVEKENKYVETYPALKRCQDSIRNHEEPPTLVPIHLRNAPNKVMKDLIYTAGYKSVDIIKTVLD